MTLLERNKRMNLRGAVGLFLVAIAISPPALGWDSEWVEYRDGLLSVDFVAADLEYALERTAQTTGVSFSVDPRLQATIDRRFERIPLELGIRRILVGYNYIMLFDDKTTGEKQVARVIVLGKAGAAGGAPAVEQQVVAPAGGKSADIEEVVLKRHQSGHYLSPGQINDFSVDFLVDTGATVVAVSNELADRIGLTYGKKRTVETANGRATGFETVLGSVALGNLYLQQVRAIILPDLNTGGRALLGMSFLEGFDLVQRQGTLTIRRRPAE